jgi:hypothetical protein
MISKKGTSTLMVFTAALCAISLTLAAGRPFVTGVSAKDDKPKLKVTIHSPVKQGMAPLPVHFVATIVAPPEMDPELYASAFEWKIMIRQVLTDRYTGGNITPPDMRSDPVDPYERMLRSSKNLESRSLIRPPHDAYDPEKKVKREFEFDYTFKQGGEYFITFRIVGLKVVSNEVRIEVKGDTTYDPFRGR